MLEKSVGEKCRREVLWRSDVGKSVVVKLVLKKNVGEKCCSKVL